MSLRIFVRTRQGVFLDYETDHVILPVTDGSIGILTGHMRLCSLIEAGLLRYKRNETWVPVVVDNGFAKIRNNIVCVVVEQAEEISASIDVQEAQKSVDVASQNLDDFKKYFNKLKSQAIEDENAAQELAKLKQSLGTRTNYDIKLKELKTEKNMAKARIAGLKYLDNLKNQRF